MGYIEDLRAIVGHRPLIFVGSVVVMVDDLGRILLQQRKIPHGSWGIPGGLMELAESAEDTARREVFEETNLNVGKLNLINVYSGPKNYVKAANGDEFYVVTIAYYTQDIQGELKMDKEEALAFDYFYPDSLPANVVKSHKLILDEFMSKHYSSLRT